MAGSQEREARVRFLEGTPEQRAAVQEVFPAEVAAGRRCVGVIFGPAVGGGHEGKIQRREETTGPLTTDNGTGEARKHRTSNAQHPTGETACGGARATMEEMLVAIRAEIAALRAERGELAGTVARIEQHIEAVARQKRELSAAKARLEQMHGEGLFAFARHVDRETRDEFMTIMACGDVAKAARDLQVSDSTLRGKVEKWSRRGKAYAILAEIVRWRKSIKGAAGREFAKRVASGEERDVDFPALIRDVIAELEELDPENWEERCSDLADALRRVAG